MASSSSKVTVQLSQEDRELLKRIVRTLEHDAGADQTFGDPNKQPLIEGSAKVYDKVYSSQAGLSSFQYQGQPNWTTLNE